MIKFRKKDCSTNVMHWTARVVSTIIGAFIFIVMILEMSFPHAAFTIEGIILSGLAFFAIASVIMGWKREDIGGIMLLLSGSALGAFAYITSGHNNFKMMSAFFIIFATPGILYLLSWQRR